MSVLPGRSWCVLLWTGQSTECQGDHSIYFYILIKNLLILFIATLVQVAGKTQLRIYHVTLPRSRGGIAASSSWSDSCASGCWSDSWLSDLLSSAVDLQWQYPQVQYSLQHSDQNCLKEMQQVLLSSVSDVSSSLLSLCPLLQNNPRHDKHDRNEIKMKLVPNDDTWTFVIFPVFKSCQVSANALLSSLPAFCINPASLSFCNRCMMSVSSSVNGILLTMSVTRPTTVPFWLCMESLTGISSLEKIVPFFFFFV